MKKINKKKIIKALRLLEEAIVKTGKDGKDNENKVYDYKEEEKKTAPTVENFFEAIHTPWKTGPWEDMLKANPSLANAQDINKERINYWGDYAIIQAIRLGRQKLLIDLIEAGADLEVIYKDITPLAWAATVDNVEIVRILLAYGASTENKGGKYGDTAADIAKNIEHPNSEEIYFLINLEKRKRDKIADEKRKKFGIVKEEKFRISSKKKIIKGFKITCKF